MNFDLHNKNTEVVERLAIYFSDKYGYEISQSEILNALLLLLSDDLGFKWASDIWSMEFSFVDCKNILENF